MPLTKQSGYRGYVLALCGAFLFGSNGVVSKVVLTTAITPAQLTFLRTLTTCLISAIALAMIDRSGFRVSKRELGMSALLGIAGVAMVQWLYATALTLIPVGIVLLIEYTAVLMVALFAKFVFHQTVRRRLWWAIGLVLIGLGVVARIWTGTLDPLGALFAFLGAVAYTIYFIVAERQVNDRHPIGVTFWSMLWAALFWGAFSGWWAIDPATFTQSLSLHGNLAGVSLPAWVLLAWACTMGSFVPFYFSFTALNYMPATAAGILASSEILWAFAVAWLWLGEALSTVQIVGALIVVLGIAVAQTARPSHEAEALHTLTGPITLPVPIQNQSLPSSCPREHVAQHVPRP